MIIAIAGKLRSGKDTAANLIMDTVGHQYCERIALADALKEETVGKYGLSIERMTSDYSYKEEIRHLLIKHGRDRRAEDIDYWVKKVLENAKAPVVIVPDLRYSNEKTSLAKGERIVLSVKIECDNENRAKHGWHLSSADTDASECQLDEDTDWDYIVYNNGTVEDLTNSLGDVISRIKTELDGA